MALKKCKECGKQVSDKAGVCPHCGAKLKMGLGKKILIGLGILILLPYFIGFLSGLSGTERVEGTSCGWGTKDCKSDGDCFQEALKGCCKAKMTLPSMMADQVFEITAKEGDACKVHYTIYSLQTSERDCLVKINIVLNGTSKTARAVDIKNHLENCSDWIIS